MQIFAIQHLQLVNFLVEFFFAIFTVLLIIWNWILLKLAFFFRNDDIKLQKKMQLPNFT